MRGLLRFPFDIEFGSCTLISAAIQPFRLGVTAPKWRNWQTRMVQVHVLARVWGFESLLRHQLLFNE